MAIVSGYIDHTFVSRLSEQVSFFLTRRVLLGVLDNKRCLRVSHDGPSNKSLPGRTYNAPASSTGRL